MLEDIRELVTEIGKVKDAYLVSCFLNEKEWRIDYYSSKDHKILTYFKQDGKLQQQKDEIFQKEQKPLQELHLEKVKISYLEALDKVAVSPDKVFIILQVIEGAIV